MLKAIVSIYFLFSVQVFACESPEAIVAKRNLKLEMSVIASNIANINTTRTPEGGPYKRRTLICKNSNCELVENLGETKKYIPDHPDASGDGYVRFPKIDLNEEISNMIEAQRDYDKIISDCN